MQVAVYAHRANLPHTTHTAQTRTAQQLKQYRFQLIIQVVGTQPGDAASLKLLRSIFTKGLEALSVECLLTAERQGLRAQLHDILGDIDQTSLKLLMESMVQTHIEHSARRQKEVAEAQRQMQQVGIRPLVLPAVEALFQRTATRQAHTPFKGQGIEAALEWLDASAH